MTIRLIPSVGRYEFRFETEDGEVLRDVDVVLMSDGFLWFVARGAPPVDESILDDPEAAGMLAVTQDGELALSEDWLRQFVDRHHADDPEVADRLDENIRLIRHEISRDQGWRNS